MENLSEQKNVGGKFNERPKNVLIVFVLILLIFLLGVVVFYFKDRFPINILKKENISTEEFVINQNQNTEINPFNKLVTEREGTYTYSNFPVFGKVMESNKEMLLVSTKDSSERPKFENPENRDKYLSDNYEVVIIPAQDSIKYVKGYFVRWEDIPGSLDKYIVIKYPPSDDSIRFRVSFEKSSLFSNDVSYLLYETSIYDDENKFFKIEPFEPEKSDFISLTFEKVKDVFKEGDILVIVPLFDPPEYNKKDSSGNYLASRVYIRKN